MDIIGLAKVKECHRNKVAEYLSLFDDYMVDEIEIIRFDRDEKYGFYLMTKEHVSYHIYNSFVEFR